MYTCVNGMEIYLLFTSSPSVMSASEEKRTHRDKFCTLTCSIVFKRKWITNAK